MRSCANSYSLTDDAADVVFADVHGVNRALHAYAEKPLRVWGREIIVFCKYTGTYKVHDMNMDLDTRDGGATFVSNPLAPTMTQEELLEAMEPSDKFWKFVMRTVCPLTDTLPLSDKWAF